METLTFGTTRKIKRITYLRKTDLKVLTSIRYVNVLPAIIKEVKEIKSSNFGDRCVRCFCFV